MSEEGQAQAPAEGVESAPEAEANTAPEGNAAPEVKDWRAEMAGDDEKLRGQLERFNTPNDFAKAYRELNKKLSSGEYERVLSDDATEEEIAEWRQSKGIPESPDKYDLTFDDGLVVGDADKPVIDSFLNRMHELGMTNQAAKEAVRWYYDLQAEQQQLTDEYDTDNASQATQALMEAWGGEYKQNLNSITNVIMEPYFGESGADLMNARMPDGRRVKDSPELMQRLGQLAYDLNPMERLMPNKSHDEAIAGIDTEIKEIKAKIGDMSLSPSERGDLRRRMNELQSLRSRAS